MAVIDAEYVNHLPKPAPRPAYDSEGMRFFVRKFVPRVQACSHWLLMVDGKMVEKFLKMQTMLGVVFEPEPVPNSVGQIMFSYPRKFIPARNMAKAFNEHLSINISEADLVNIIYIFASDPASMDAMSAVNRILLDVAKAETEKEGCGYKALDRDIAFAAIRVEKLRHAHLN